MKMMGIVDALGLESFMPFEANRDNIILLKIRVKANTHRNAIYYCLNFTEEEINTIRNTIKDGKREGFIEAGVMVILKIDSIDGSNHTVTNKKIRNNYKAMGYL